MISAGVVRREPYRETGQREHHEYRLTDKGRDLVPVVVALMQWGDRWEADPEGPPSLDRALAPGRHVRPSA
ncbi:winged helix-turn-helix transcriptional regulator [Mycolicibacterium hodleri]|uniref:winged helix-turn-helix transcriptional regulator n=1 Tax=Mycolicibacterium hodleri TaxID=49897 RepID=UPI003183B47B